MIDELLGEARRTELQRRLALCQASAPAHGLISITLDLGCGTDTWLPAALDRSATFWWAQPEKGSFRLALGQALLVATAGPARFSALQAAFAGLSPAWLHDDTAAGGELPAAHLGFAFDAHAGESGGDQAPRAASLDGLPNCRLLVPAILLQTRNGRCHATFSCTGRDSHLAPDYWQRTLLAARATDALPSSRPNLQLRRENEALGERAFLARAQAALAAIADGQFEKLVLTRRARLTANRPLDLNRLAALLLHRQPNCTLYSVGVQGGAFMGATPERLLALQGDEAEADALAGTAWSGLGRRQHAGSPGSPGLHDEKNSREQQIVVDAITGALAPVCRTLAAPAAQTMQIRELQHLRSRIVGKLKPGTGLFDLLARLHPTPAVGGTPTAAASHWLRTHGDERPAWYTGGVGWIDRQGNGEIAVALRCARIHGAQAELLAGAGLVAGSDPQQELAETEAKLGALLGALEALASPAHASGMHGVPPRTGTR